MDEKDIAKIEELFKCHTGILSENFQEKLDIVIEGHHALSEKIDHVETTLNRRMAGLEKRIDYVEVKLSNKIDNVAAELAAHRADTESIVAYIQ